MAPGQIKQNNILHLWGNEKTMNLNSLILTNIQSSHYFKVNLYELKTYHEVIDEIYYKVEHLEPWEKGSRKTSGQTGMCGGVRGVGAGGIVSTAYCLLYKLFTLKLTRKQVNGLISHSDSAYIRALGFMYIRYTQPPADLWDWYGSYLDDEEEIDPKAGGGSLMTVGELLRNFLTKLEWYSSLFPRIPVPIQKEIEKKLNEWKALQKPVEETPEENSWAESEISRSREKPRRDERSHRADDRESWDRQDRHEREKPKNREYEKNRHRQRSPEYSRHRDSKRNGDISEQIVREKERPRKERDRSDHKQHRSNSQNKERSSTHRSHKSERKHRSRSRSRDRSFR